MSTVTPLPRRRTVEGSAALDVARIRDQFPVLRREFDGTPLVYLDNAATTQKPQCVIDAICRYYSSECSNIDRGVHRLAEEATRAYDKARARVARFLGARDAREIVFVRGATEAINLVAQSYGATHIRPDDQIIVSAMEHHSNLVPWQILCRQTGAVLRVAPVDDDGRFLLDAYERLLGTKTALVAMTHASNVLGTITPVREIVDLAHQHGAPVLLDGAQAAPHLPVDVAQLDCDFYAASGHKLYGPTGIGVLYGKAELLDSMPPHQAGGGMIRSVSFEGAAYDRPPGRFEAGTPNIAGAFGLAAAMDFVDSLGRERIAAHEQDLLRYATDRLSVLPGVRILGAAPDKVAIVSFTLDGVHPHDVGTILDSHGIASRTGHHCAEPLARRFGVPATTRVSFGLYNTIHEVDAFVHALERVKEVFR
jgi:cysteine desulfurase/selenocysteine lyase